MKLVSKVTEILKRHKPDAIFVDSGAMGGPIGDRLRQLGYNAFDVGFGDNAADEKQYKSRTAEMWGRLLKWLYAGGAIKDNAILEGELTNRMFDHNDKMQLVMEKKREMKKRGLASPDWADALCLTFAEHVPKLVIAHNDVHTMRGKPVKKKGSRSVLDRLK
jgi:phage terminase large subunit